MRLEPIQVSLDSLLFDPNNYRFHDLDDWRRVKEDRFHEPRVQESVFRLLRSTPAFDVNSLKESIRTNGFVPLEQLVVRRYTTDSSKYVVIEGNRRVAAIRWLLEEDAEAIISLCKETKDSLQQLNVLSLDLTLQDNFQAIEVLMAIRHVSGIVEWGAYQQARLIVHLMDSETASFSDIAARLGMGAREVARRFRASKALQQMEHDDEFRDYVDPKMYAIFHETVAQPLIRDWLEWDDNEYIFTNRDTLSSFYTLICEIDGQPAKIKNGYEDVRIKLKAIVQHPRALQALLEPNSTLEDAYTIAKEEAGLEGASENFDIAIRGAYRALSDLPTIKLRTLTEVQRGNIRDLITLLAQTSNDFERLKGEPL